MSIPVLIVDADEEYRNLTAKTLEGTGQFKPYPSDSAGNALPLLVKSKAQIAMIDLELPEQDGLDLIRNLLKHDKHLLVIAIVDDEAAQSKQLIELNVKAIIEKPYYLPELPQIIKTALQSPSVLPKSSTPVSKPQSKSIEAAEAGYPQWLMDPARSCDFLTRLYDHHSAKALLILRGANLWAQSSQLTVDQGKTIAHMLLNKEQDLPKDSIVRFIRLNDLEGDYLLYALHLVDQYQLVLLYDSEKSFSIARRQAKYVSQLILTKDPQLLPPQEPEALDEGAAVPTLQPQDSTLPSDWIPQSPASVEDFPQLTELDIPPPDPAISILEEVAVSTPVATELPPLPTDWFPKRPTPTSALPFLSEEEIGKAPVRGGTSDGEIQHEARFHLPFSAVLITNLSSHQLDDSLVKKVEPWVQDLCIAWGWHATKVQVSSESLQLTLHLSPDTAPSKAIQQIANDLSKQILAANPGFSDDLPTGQFWATRYLLVAGDAIEDDRIQSFISAARLDQSTTASP